MTTLALSAVWLATATVDLTDNTFDQHVGKSLHSMVEFHAPWCTACAAFSPALASAIKELVRERPDLQFMRVDGDAQPGLRERFQIEEAPSLLLFPAGARGSRATAARLRRARGGCAAVLLPPPPHVPADSIPPRADDLLCGRPVKGN